VVLLDKPAGGLREIRIPSVRDRVVQQALALVLGRRLDELYSDISFAYRPRRSREGAVLTLARQAKRTGLTWVARIDIRSFFDTIDHERLVLALRGFGVPEELIRLVRVTLHAGVLRRGRVVSNLRGCPQGSPLSPLLSNAYLVDRGPGQALSPRRRNGPGAASSLDRRDVARRCPVQPRGTAPRGARPWEGRTRWRWPSPVCSSSAPACGTLAARFERIEEDARGWF
jgi:hypothetical protein